jgi:hypothetical protein
MRVTHRIPTSVSLTLVLLSLPLALAAASLDLSFPSPDPTLSNPWTSVDLDNDGVLDRLRVEFNHDGWELYWQRGSASGEFGAPQQIPFNPGSSSEDISLAATVDLTAEGLPEIVLVSSCNACNCPAGELLVLVNHGAGVFTLPRRYRIGGSGKLRCADMDGNGNIDLLIEERDSLDGCTSNTAACRVMVNDGSASAFRSYFFAGDGPYAAADFNGDGRPDIVSGSTGLLYPSIDDGVLGPGIPLLSGALGPGVFVNAQDLDANGTMDLVLAAAKVHVLLGDGHGAFHDRVYDSEATTPSLVVDLDADGGEDYAFGSGYNKLVLFHHAQADVFDWTTVPVGFYNVITEDFNGDQLPDFLTSDIGSFQPVLSTGNRAYVLGPRYDGNIDVPGLGDFDGDGFIDLLSSGSCAALYRGRGNGEFVAPLVEFLSVGSGGFLLVDLDGDEIQDVVSTQAIPSAGGAGRRRAALQLLRPTRLDFRCTRRPPPTSTTMETTISSWRVTTLVAAETWRFSSTVAVATSLHPSDTDPSCSQHASPLPTSITMVTWMSPRTARRVSSPYGVALETDNSRGRPIGKRAHPVLWLLPISMATGTSTLPRTSKTGPTFYATPVNGPSQRRASCRRRLEPVPDRS